ncbi:beta-ketoacyl reductase [Streptomyces klenkii]|uniref:beta-ketoacyl reductase n=1 Tax=Streptomyces klenkii TaxID=1420899 RepID=UPI003445FD58
MRALTDAVVGSLVRHGARVRTGGEGRADLVVALPGTEPVAEPGVPRWVLSAGGPVPECEHVVFLPEKTDALARPRLCAAIAAGLRETWIRPGGMFVREYGPVDPAGPWQPQGDVLVAGPADALTGATADAVLRSGARLLVAGGVPCPPGAAGDTVELTAAVVRAGSGFDDVTAPRAALVSVGVLPPAPVGEAAGDGGTTLVTAVDPALDPRAAAAGLLRALAGDEAAVRLVDPDRGADLPAPATAGAPAPSSEEAGSHEEPLLAEQPPAEEPAAATAQQQDSELWAVLENLSREEWPEAVLDGVRRLAAAVLGHDSASAIGIEDEFFDLGLTSVAALELRDHLTTLTGLEWPADVLYECPTPRVLTDLVVERLIADRG